MGVNNTRSDGASTPPDRTDQGKVTERQITPRSRAGQVSGDDTVRVAGIESPPIATGEYPALVRSWRTVRRFGRQVKEVRLRLYGIGPQCGVELILYCALNPDGTATRRGKLLRWWKMALDGTNRQVRRDQ